MSDKLEYVKTFAPIAAPLTAAIVETWVKPKLQKLAKSLRTDKTLFENALATKFHEYLQRSYEKHSYINVIVFQNRQKRLVDIYLPLTVERDDREEVILIDSYREEFLSTYKKVLVRDAAGMGKSTMLKRLFLSCADENAGIPIFIELRKLRGDESLLSYIYNELNPVDDEFDQDFILKLIRDGGFVFFLDGYDEIPFSERDKVTIKLQDFISKAGNNLFIVTSRPESSLASFTDFQVFNIKPLEDEEAYELLKKYDNAGELSAEIISKLDGGAFQNIREFLSNPLLISLLYKSYEYKHTIPFKKHIFYRQVYDALFESHDLTKGGSFIREKHTALDVEDFHKVLRVLGFITVKLGQIEYDKDTLLALLKRAKEHCCDLNFKESDFLKDLLATVPLFNRDGIYYRWTHKAFQEYFAAQFIWLDTKGNQAKILRQMVRSSNSETYMNVLDLYYDVDSKTFQQTLAYDFICEFIEHYDSSYRLISRKEVSEEDIHNRKLLTFGRICLLYNGGRVTLLSEDINSTLAELASASSDISDALQGIKVSSIYAPNFVASLFNHNAIVARILSEKLSGIFINLDEWKVHKKLVELHEQRLSCPAVGQELIRDIGIDVSLISDSPDSLFNKRTHFETINVLIYGESPYSDKYLDVNVCRELKQKIEGDMAREDSDDFLFNNI